MFHSRGTPISSTWPNGSVSVKRTFFSRFFLIAFQYRHWRILTYCVGLLGRAASNGRGQKQERAFLKLNCGRLFCNEFPYADGRDAQRPVDLALAQCEENRAKQRFTIRRSSFLFEYKVRHPRRNSLAVSDPKTEPGLRSRNPPPHWLEKGSLTNQWPAWTWRLQARVGSPRSRALLAVLVGLDQSGSWLALYKNR